MSVSTDIASLEIIAAVSKCRSLDEASNYLVHTLQKHVAHFDWVGLYLINEGEFELIASAGEEFPYPSQRKEILQVPILSLNGDLLGKITVTSKKKVAFDQTDYTTLETLAEELSLKIQELS